MGQVMFRIALGAAILSAAASPALAVDAVVPPSDHMSCTGAPHEVRVTISGVKKSVGLIVADLYRDDPEGFLKRDGRVDQVRFAAKAPQTTFCLHAPRAGAFAIALYHDENANKTLDKRAFGIPAEPFGISNNPVIRFSAPKLEETLFEVAEYGADVAIELKN